jgi:hypothetical protein
MTFCNLRLTLLRIKQQPCSERAKRCPISDTGYAKRLNLPHIGGYNNPHIMARKIMRHFRGYEYMRR